MAESRGELVRALLVERGLTPGDIPRRVAEAADAAAERVEHLSLEDAGEQLGLAPEAVRLRAQDLHGPARP